MCNSLLRCDNIDSCDAYCKLALKGNLLGDPEPKKGELDHLAKIISCELRMRPGNLSSSICVAIFLVWMGFLYYREGDYWGPVYRKLGLPNEQAKWQGVLGRAFLGAVKKHGLYDFQGGLSYVIPILAHGYIPNCYLNNFVANVLLPIYMEWKGADLEPGWEEAEHLVTSWRLEYAKYEKYRKIIAVCESKEEEINNICIAWQHRDLLAQLQKWENEIVHKEELTELLLVPERLLDRLENRKTELQLLLQRKAAYIQARKSFKAKEQVLKAREQEIAKLAGRVFHNWHNDFAHLIIGFPMDRIKVWLKEIKARRNVFFRLKMLFFQIFTPTKFKRLIRAGEELEQLFLPLQIKEDILKQPMPTLTNIIRQLQGLLRERNLELTALAEIDAAIKEAAASCERAAFEDDTSVQQELNKVSQELGRYKTLLVQLGKGREEAGKEELMIQRELRQNINLFQTRLGQDASVLMPLLPQVKSLANIDEFEARLIRIRNQKNEVSKKAKAFKNPLYQLNESSRVFIFQGGMTATQFVHRSLQLIDRLQKNESANKTGLPDRIESYIRQWWEKEGRKTYEATINAEKEQRQKTKVMVRKPTLIFDPNEEQIKVFLPSQPVRQKKPASLYVGGGPGSKQKITLPLLLDDETGLLRSDEIEFPLERPQKQYSLHFICGDDSRYWNYNGLGPSHLHMLFNSQGKLVENRVLPDGGFFLISPLVTSTVPVGAIREQLSGHWSGYEYRYVDTHVLAVRTGEALSIYKGAQQLEPQLLSGETLEQINSNGAPLYLDQLPNLVFSVKGKEEIPFYGLRLDKGEERKFFPLENLDASQTEDDIVCVNLAALSQGKYGHYKITLVKYDRVLWQTEVAVVPDLRLRFDRLIYKPQDKVQEKGRLEFLSRNRCDFVPQKEEGSLITSVSPTVVEFDTKQHFIAGSLVYHLEEQVPIMINVQIPVIRWRKQNGEWQASVKEIWHEDLGAIEIEVPLAAGAEVKLSLEGGKQILVSPVQQGKAVFDLCRFSDTLRGTNKPTQKIFFSCLNKKILPFTLLRVRTRWQVQDIRMTQRLQGDRRNLLVQWRDLGRASGRVLRFWPLDMPGVDYIERSIPDGHCNAEIEVLAIKMPPGLYRLQLDKQDSWSSDVAMAPRSGTENCIDIDVGSKEELLQAYLGKCLEIVAASHEDKIISIEPNYWVKVTGLNPTFDEEARLEGNVYTVAADGTIKGMPFNPVGFYLQGNKMPFLIDKDSDGATYCRRCKMWFWEIGHHECGNAVIAPESIYIRVGDDR